MVHRHEDNNLHQRLIKANGRKSASAAIPVWANVAFLTGRRIALERCPFLDRIDLHIEMQAVSAADLVLPPPSEGSAEVAARVASARAIQSTRYRDTSARTNAEADGPVLDAQATPDEPGQKLLAQAAEAMRMSARGYTRVLRVARTIADLTGAEQVGRIHVAEALSYRRQAPRA